MLNKIKKAVRYLTNSDYRFLINSNITGCPKMSDEDFLRRKFKACMGRELDLGNPKTFNEKLQCLKLCDRRPEYTMMVDKYLVRDFIRERLGEEYLIPLIGAWDSPDEIDFDALPNQFVLKCNHNSGLGMYICKDKSKLDVEAVKKELRRGLAQDYYLMGREWPYKNVPRKIICEEYIEDSCGELSDYKFFCFDGKIDCVMIVAGRAKNQAKFYYMNKDWKVLPYGRLTRSLPEDFTLPKPINLEEMFQVAEKLSCGFPHVRIDLYNVDGRIYFGEFTLYSQSGFEDGFDYKSDKHLGDQIVLPRKYNK